MNGIAFDVKRFSVNDGNGIRSTLFLKGCPLRCPWCHNPEGLTRDIELLCNRALCLRCGSCVRVCARRALSLAPEGLSIDHGRCAMCLACAEACPVNALRPSGFPLSPEDAASLLLRDRAFFGEGGGVTLSGGEALYQPEFCLALLALLRKERVDIAIETCLMLEEELLAHTLGLTDHYLADIKYIDSDTHRRVIGASNARILQNYEFLVRKDADVLVRVPLIPGFTATEENVGGIARYISRVNPGQRVQLLNYNPLGRGKYESQNRRYPVEGTPLSDAELDRFYAILEGEKLLAVRE